MTVLYFVGVHFQWRRGSFGRHWLKEFCRRASEEVFWWCCNSSSSFEYSCIKVQCTFYGVRQRGGGEKRGCFGEVAVEAAFSLVGAPSEDPHQYHASHRANFQLIVILWEKEYFIVILGLGFILFATSCCGRFLKHLPDELLPRKTHTSTTSVTMLPSSW